MLVATLLLCLMPQTPIIIRPPAPPSYQQTLPPQPQYHMYGSLARQRTVYMNVQQQDAEEQLRQYRRFRDEVNRRLVYEPSNTVIYERRAIPVRIQR